MQHIDKFFISGQWVTPNSSSAMDVINPATAKPFLRQNLADTIDIETAINAARTAFPAWAATPATTRKDLMYTIADEMAVRADDFVDAHVACMGIPKHQAYAYHVEAPIEAMRYFAEQCTKTDTTQEINNVLICHEPIGVCAFINPWNYPLLQLIGKVGPALAAGCTMVAKPAEQTPLPDVIMAEIFEKVGLPDGVFNLVFGIGNEIGHALCSHPEVDLVSITGSTAAGVKVAQAAAPTVKRVCQELGGKSALIITETAPLEEALQFGVEHVMANVGQTCDAYARILIPSALKAKATKIAQHLAEAHQVGDPLDNTTTMGPLNSALQRDRVVEYIRIGIEEDKATLLCGGTTRPAGLPQHLANGAFVQPTIFTDVTPEMRIAREEIFGPVICLMWYETLEDAIAIANRSEYGLSASVYAKNKAEALPIAHRLQAGQVVIQGGAFTLDAPFGGYKQSGNGREWGPNAVEEYLETKAIICGDG